MKLTRCFLCGSEDVHIIHRGTRGESSVDVLQCDFCGLVRLSEVVDDIDTFTYIIEDGIAEFCWEL